MMVRAVLFLAWAAILLPAHGVLLWQKDTDYMDFTIMKSCFGEEVAVQLERFAYSVGQYCEETEGTSGNSLPVEFTSQRKKRLKEDEEVDYARVEDQLRQIRIDAGLKESMMRVLTSCRNSQVQLPDLLPGDPDNTLVKALITIGNYFSCIIDGGMKTCRNFEMQRYFPNFQ